MKKFFCLIFFLIFISCNKQEEANTFSYAVSGEFRPFSFVKNDGELAGFDVEVGKLIAIELGKTPKPIKYKFAGIIEGLKSSRFDAAVASHTITPERAKFVDFSTPYYYSGPHVFSREKQDKVDLKNAEVAVSKGSTYQNSAKEFTSNIKIYDSDITALEALDKGRHQAVITDLITGTMAIKNGLEGVMINQSLGASEQGIAVDNENDELLKKINEALNNLRKSGKLKQLSMKYFSRDITSN